MFTQTVFHPHDITRILQPSKKYESAFECRSNRYVQKENCFFFFFFCFRRVVIIWRRVLSLRYTPKKRKRRNEERKKKKDNLKQPNKSSGKREERSICAPETPALFGCCQITSTTYCVSLGTKRCSRISR